MILMYKLINMYFSEFLQLGGIRLCVFLCGSSRSAMIDGFFLNVKAPNARYIYIYIYIYTYIYIFIYLFIFIYIVTKYLKTENSKNINQQKIGSHSHTLNIILTIYLFILHFKYICIHI